MIFFEEFLFSFLWFQIASQHPILYHPQSELFT